MTQTYEDGFYLKAILKKSQSTQTHQSLISAQTAINQIDERVIFQAKFHEVAYDYMKVQNKRFKTFASCEKNITPERALELAENGFFYITGNLIQCRYCYQLFEDWDSWKLGYMEFKHEELSPTCPFVRRKGVSNIVPCYRKVSEVPTKDYCGYYSPYDYVFPSLKGFQIGDTDDEDENSSSSSSS